MRVLVTNRNHQRGESLAGLMVGMTLGMIVLAGAVAIMANTVSVNGTALRISRLNLELRSIMDLMVRDIRRAQFSATAVDCLGGASCSNPFSDGTEDWSVTSGQIDFTYDENADGAQDTGECSGFRRTVSAGVGEVEKKTSCTPAWQPLSDSNSTNITTLAFSEGLVCIPSGAAYLAMREVKILLAGSDTDGQVSRRMCETIRIKNDRLSSACTAAPVSTTAPFDVCPP